MDRGYPAVLPRRASHSAARRAGISGRPRMTYYGGGRRGPGSAQTVVPGLMCTGPVAALFITIQGGRL
jgi:hypothetical protein